MDYVNVNVLAVLLHHSYAGCYHCGKLGEGGTQELSVLVPTTAHESTITSK
jgi:hypothetical protein